MAAPGAILAVDLSTSTGWALGDAGRVAPECGTWKLPGGTSDMAQAWVELQNNLEDLITVARPALLVFATPLAVSQTTARLLLGLAAHAESSAYRMKVRCREVAESTARKEVLGRGSFTVRGADGRPVKGAGRTAAKSAVMAWCEAQGWPVANDDEGDACVVWEYARRLYREGAAA